MAEPPARFRLGRIVATTGALEVMQRAGAAPQHRLCVIRAATFVSWTRATSATRHTQLDRSTISTGADE